VRQSASTLERTLCLVLAAIIVTAVPSITRAQPSDTLVAEPLLPDNGPAVQPWPETPTENWWTAPVALDESGAGQPFDGPAFEQSKLTGDWFGQRTALWKNGITLDASTTQFYQGVTSGGLEQSFPYGGRNDYFLGLDGQKLGLWQGLYVNLHGETRYGESANFNTGAFSPVNGMLALPVDHGSVTAFTRVKFTQYLTPNTLIYAGKINLFDEIRQPFTKSTVLDGFVNMSLIFNMIFARTLPYSTLGAGFVYLQNEESILSLAVYDTNNTPTVSGFDTFFNNGATVFWAGNLPTRLFGLPGHQGVSGTYSSGRYTNLQPSPYLDPLEGLAIPLPPKSGSWSVTYNFSQAVHVSPDDPQRMWGVFGNFGFADSNPNTVRRFASAGISGASPLATRAGDTFGIGYFYLGLSDLLKQSAPPGKPLGNEHGVELYYNARITPSFQLTPDLQVIEPFQQQDRTAFIFGLRAKLDF
jgi:porin